MTGKSIGQPVPEIPRGIEVLVKKAAVDPAFRELLLAKRAAAADEIGLTLDPTEAAMLNAASEAQLKLIIAQTHVDPAIRWAFLGKVAAVMLLAVGVATAGTPPAGTSAGISPDYPSQGADKLLNIVRTMTGDRAIEVAAPLPAAKPTTRPTSRPMPPAPAGMRVDQPAPNPSVISPALRLLYGGGTWGCTADRPEQVDETFGIVALFLEAKDATVQQAATQRLRQEGPALLPKLKALQAATELSAEQKRRLGALIDSLQTKPLD